MDNLSCQVVIASRHNKFSYCAHPFQGLRVHSYVVKRLLMLIPDCNVKSQMHGAPLCKDVERLSFSVFDLPIEQAALWPKWRKIAGMCGLDWGEIAIQLHCTRDSRNKLRQ